MTSNWWLVISIVGYLIVGAIAARCVFEYACRFSTPSYHDMPDNAHMYSNKGCKDDVHANMFFMFGLWPVILTGLAVGCSAVAVGKLLVAKPPPKRLTPEERIAKLEKENKELERRLGMGIGYYVVEDITEYRPFNQGGIIR